MQKAMQAGNQWDGDEEDGGSDGELEEDDGNLGSFWDLGLRIGEVAGIFLKTYPEDLDPQPMAYVVDAIVDQGWVGCVALGSSPWI
jgi:hypothetical protein